MSPRVTVVTYLPSPYQVEFFDAISRAGGVDLTVIYLTAHSRASIARLWSPALQGHRGLTLTRGGVTPEARQACDAADLVVFNYYRHPAAIELIQRRARKGRPWCFWGERLGASGWRRLGAIYRHFGFAALRRSSVAIWGIGRVAADNYRNTYGAGRRYFNIPYFSDLARFSAVATRPRPDPTVRTFLFSGALIRRKGVDLLATAFARTARRAPQCRLLVVGAGELEAPVKRRLAACLDAARFVGGQPWPALPGWYAQADVLVAPSRHDGWAMVVPEALAAGLPVVSTRATGAACEFIEPSNGWLIDAGNASSLAEAMGEAAMLPAADLVARSHAARAAVARHQLADGVDRFGEAVMGSIAAFVA